MRKLIAAVLLGGLCLASPVSAEPTKTPTAPAAAVYTCPMHSEVSQAKPGICPQCRMKLVQKTPKAYVCPMHPEVTSSKPGTCSKCKMALVKKPAK